MDLYRLLATLRRPKILIRAARLGLAYYDREADLRHVIRAQRTPTRDRALEQLLIREETLEGARTTGGAGYSVQEHVRVLTALLCEARLPGRRDNHMAG